MYILEQAQAKEIQRLLSLGFCLVPSNIKNNDNKPKVPWGGWKKITKRLDANQLADLLVQCSADSVAVVAGAISGNLFLVDIDSKFKPGIDASVFGEIKELYPEIWEKIRIEKTISGGYRILYRINLKGEDGVDHPFPDFSGAIASREATEDELISKPKTKKYGFIETKNICQVFPSPGYSIVKSGLDEDGWFTARLSWNEHSSLLALLKEYDELELKDLYESYSKLKTKEDSDFYDENPFEHFNNGDKKDQVFEIIGGWKFKKNNGKWNYYKKEDSKSNGDDAIYNIANNFYKIYTTTSGLDDKGYSPIGLLIEGKFGGDKKECRAWLVANGYGKIKPSKEKWLISRAINKNEDEEKLPPNISESAKEDFREQKKKRQEKYPFGIFWEIEDEGKISINREKLYNVSYNLGFRVNGNDVCLIGSGYESHVISIVDERIYFDSVKIYMDDVSDEVKSAYESFLQKSGKFTISRLSVLDHNLLLNSNKEISYKAYKNGYVRVGFKGYEFFAHGTGEGGDKLIWKHQIQERDFKEFGGDSEELVFEKVKNGLYFRFLEKAFGIKEEEILYYIQNHGIVEKFGTTEYINNTLIHLLKCIGYYAHDYKSTTTPYVVVLCEMCEDFRKGGGSGKNVFTNLLKYTTSLLNKPAKNVKFDDTLLRTWKGQKVLSFNDAEKKFDYLGLRELSAGEGEVGKKFQQELTIANKDMPKLIVNTNFSFDPSLPGLKRRLIAAEFSDFFTLAGGVDVFFKKEFPSDGINKGDWTDEDFIGYDWLIIRAVQEFLKAGCKLAIREMSDGGWIKQFEQRFYKPTYLFIKDNIETWLELEKVRINDWFGIRNSRLSDFYDENGIDKNWRLSSIKMNEALEEYCSHFGIEFVASKNIGREPNSNVQINAKVFKKIGGSVSSKEKDDVPF